jgi:hypothetical protein
MRAVAVKPLVTTKAVLTTTTTTEKKEKNYMTFLQKFTQI